MLWLGELQRANPGAAEIAAALEARIIDGRLIPDDRLPSVRDLAKELAVSATTVSSAYQQLRRRGLAIGKGRQGTVVAQTIFASPLRAPVVPEGTRNLADSNPDPELLPDLTSLMRRLRVPARLYGSGSDVPDLLETGRAWLREDGVAADDVMLVSGGMDGIERVLRARLRPGDMVAVEDPGYAVLRELLHTMGLRPQPVPVDDEGLRPEPLDRVLQAGALAIVSTPRAQNPFGCQMTEQRSRDLRRTIGRNRNVLVIEDDHGAGLATGPMASITPGHPGPWAVVRSPAKLIGPDLRIAFLTGDPVTMPRVRSSFLMGPGWVSNILQKVALEALRHARDGQLAAQVAACYAQRRTALLDALRDQGVTAYGKSGLNVWLPVPDESAMVAHLLTQGWAVAAGQRFRFGSEPAVRITASTLAPADAVQLAGRIAAALRLPASARHA
jgi:DNA-binding transcriptional MocR family regulator